MFVWSYVTAILLMLTGIFVIFLVLIQRGRGGGLAGAFGGLGGQSAFGTKAGDVFTRITIVAFVIWVILAAGGGFAMRSESEGRFKAGGGTAADTPAATSDVTSDTTPDDTAGEESNPFDGDLKTGAPSDEPGETSPSTSPPQNDRNDTSQSSESSPAENP